MKPDPRYGDPFHWWGPGWRAPVTRDLGDLLRDETIDPESAAVLWAALARRQSLAVVAGPSGVGKTTLLTALLGFLPPSTRRIYPRGCFETFAFLSDPGIDPHQTVLLINEISPHLPVYHWGPAVARLLHARERGFMLLATAHATSPMEFVATLTGSPLRIPAPVAAGFDLLVVMDRSAERQSGRHVREIGRLRATRTGVLVDVVGPRLISNIPNEKHLSSSNPEHSRPPFAEHELTERRRVLTDLRDGRISALPEFR